MNDERPLIVARDVKKSYARGTVRTDVLLGVDFAVEPGSFAVLVGPSGCGKSTLLNLVGGLDVLDEGELTVAGTELHATDEATRRDFRRDNVSFVFQYYQLLPTLTALENVEVVLEPLNVPRNERRRRAIELFDELDLRGKENHFPAELSGGEQQRVAVARALVKRPKLVLADEPTGSLDRRRGTEIVELMANQQHETGATFFVVTHDPVVVDRGSVVFEMHDGTVSRR